MAAACWGTMEANEILLQASKLPQQCFDIHLTPREEKMQKGKKGAAQVRKRQTRLKEGREARKEEEVEGWRHGVEIKNRPCVALFGLSWDPGCTKSHSCHFV